MFKVSAALETRWGVLSGEISDRRKRENSLSNLSASEQRRGRFENYRMNATENQALAFLAVKSVSGGRQGVSTSSGSVTRSMTTRLHSVASGAQPAVVKMQSYGSGARMGAMFNYVSREGELELENERGEKIKGNEGFNDIREDWKELVSNRRESKDVAEFSVEIREHDKNGSGVSKAELAQMALASSFADRKLAYGFEEKSDGTVTVKGLVVLRSETGERLTADAKATEITNNRFDQSDVGNVAEAKFRFGAVGNGTEFARAKANTMFEADKTIINENGDSVELEKFTKSLSKEWHPVMESRKVRDVMHIMVSAREGTAAENFEKSAREFFADAFQGHKYVFAVHDPATDPKEAEQGGQRPHVHAHAIVTVAKRDGERLRPNIAMFREWREKMAFHARENGIAMEMTDRREFANAPSFKAKDVNPAYDKEKGAKTKHEFVSASSERRVKNKRTNRVFTIRTDKSRDYANAAIRSWDEVKKVANGNNVILFASQAQLRVQQGQAQASFEQGEIGQGFESVVGKERIMAELNPSQIPDVKDRANAAIAALGNSGLSEDRQKVAREQIEKFVESASKLAQVRGAVRDSLTDEDRDRYDSITDRKNDVLRSVENGKPTPDQERDIGQANRELSQIERSAQSERGDQEVAKSNFDGTKIGASENVRDVDSSTGNSSPSDNRADGTTNQSDDSRNAQQNEQEARQRETSERAELNRRAEQLRQNSERQRQLEQEQER